jgi:D-amino-acid oxidase
VSFWKHRVGSLDEAYDLVLPDELATKFGVERLQVDLVINATGLGAKTLVGVQDETVYPIRGQTVLVKSDLAGGTGKRCYMGTRNLTVGPKGKPAESSYIIPRPGPSNTMILGGTFLKNEWNTLPDMAVAERILQDAFKLNPDLAGPERPGQERTWRDIEVVSHNVGLRPAREGGVRVELEQRQVNSASSSYPLIPGPKTWVDEKGKVIRQVAVLHAYGIGPAGFQASLGIAETAAKLAEGWYERVANKEKRQAKL